MQKSKPQSNQKNQIPPHQQMKIPKYRFSIFKGGIIVAAIVNGKHDILKLNITHITLLNLTFEINAPFKK